MSYQEKEENKQKIFKIQQVSDHISYKNAQKILYTFAFGPETGI